MILADKIINLRKQNNWSQEILAEKLEVSRQSVSKWESALATPDIEKLLKMSEIFGISLDALVKDEYDITGETIEQKPDERITVTSEQAQEYLEITEAVAPKIAFGVFLCIFGASIFLSFPAIAEFLNLNVNTDSALAVGLCTLLIFVAGAVFLFIAHGLKLKPYEYLESEEIVLAEATKTSVRRKKEELSQTYPYKMALGVIPIILGVIPTIWASINNYADKYILLTTGFLVFMTSFGVYTIILANMPITACKKLLEIDDYSKSRKRANKTVKHIAGLYWLSVVTIYLAYSFVTDDWNKSWIIWPISSLIFGCISVGLTIFKK